MVFLYLRGAHAIDLSEVALLKNGREVVIDKHRGFSGNNLNRIVYALQLSKDRKGAE